MCQVLCTVQTLVMSNAADFQRYVAVSKQTRKIFAEFDPDMEAGSLDEAFLDITSYCVLHNMTGTQAARSCCGIFILACSYEFRRLLVDGPPGEGHAPWCRNMPAVLAVT